MGLRWAEGRRVDAVSGELGEPEPGQLAADTLEPGGVGHGESVPVEVSQVEVSPVEVGSGEAVSGRGAAGEAELPEGRVDQIDLSRHPLVAGLGDVAMQRARGPQVFVDARQNWLLQQANSAEESLSVLPSDVLSELRQIAGEIVGRVSGSSVSEPLLQQVLPMATVFLRDALQFTGGLIEPAAKAAEAMVSTLVGALGLPRLPQPSTPEPAHMVSVPALGPDDLHHVSLRQRLTQLTGSAPDLVAARGAWWAGLEAQAELVVDNFEPVAVAPLSFVANSMVNNRLAVTEGVAELGDEAREQIRSGLSVVLLAALLQSWSAQGGTGLPPGRRCVRWLSSPTT